MAPLEQTIRDKAGKHQLQRTGENQRKGHQVSNGDLELADEIRGKVLAGMDQADSEDRNHRQHPRPVADDGGIRVSLPLPANRLFLHQPTQFESDSGHQSSPIL